MKRPLFVLLCLWTPYLWADAFDDALLQAGVPKDGIAQIRKGTNVRSPEKVDAIVQWLKSQGVKDAGKVLTSLPNVLSYRVEYNLNPKVRWLKEQGVKNTGKIVTSFPSVLGFSIEENLNPKARWLKDNGVKDIGKVLSSYPSVLGLSIEEALDPKVQWLKDQGVKNTGKVLSSFPSVLGLSIEENLNPKVKWLKGQGVTDTGRVLTSFPQVLGLSIEENLNPKVQWLKDQGVNDIGKILSSFSPLLGLSIEDNLSPTLAFLRGVFRLSIPDIESNPVLLGASLSRLEEIAHWAQTADVDLGRLSMASKSSLIRSTNVRDIFRNLKQLLGEIKARVPDADARLEILENTLGQLEATEVRGAPATSLLLRKYPQGRIPTKNMKECLGALGLLGR